ncbi:hypothetical protein JQ604_18830 [Bradyrhizobium jicamae]|uniref:hypothetical protein n=1 Tax=Bradyrhizobium jicamae TaxID=280332 RepID=UPI001BAB9FCF|nr:hypothetical protein [Bradyrhizobium jicamae]MBR0754244.1 hypothetical protein [Bradyrhizobium jicamae]
MSTPNEHIEQLVQERWREIGLSQADLAEALGAVGAEERSSPYGAPKVDTGRLMRVAEVLGITADIVNPQAGSAAHARARVQSALPLQFLLELRMLRAFREMRDPKAKRVLVELAEQILKHQSDPPDAAS